MNEVKHRVVVMVNDAVVTMEQTQKQLAELLRKDSVKLISVNADKPTYNRKQRKRA